MAVVTYGSWVASSVVEEKSSRVMELLVTAATPRQLLAGKVIGTGAAGLTQYLAVVAAALAGLVLEGTVARIVLGESSGASLEGLNLWVLGPFGVFFIGGFALYALLYAGLGSMASRQEDVQQVVGPMILIGMFRLLRRVHGPERPPTRRGSGGSRWCPSSARTCCRCGCCIERRAVGDGARCGRADGRLPGGCPVGRGARLYSAGVLLYGQRVGLRSVWRATRVHR